MDKATIEHMKNTMQVIHSRSANAIRHIEHLSEDYGAIEKEVANLRLLSPGGHSDNGTEVGKGLGESTGGQVESPWGEARFNMAPIERPPMNLKDGDIDFSGAKNLEERLVRIAKATMDGVVLCTQVRDILIETGELRSSRRNMRNAVQTLLSKHRDFQHIAPGAFRYLPSRG